MKRSEHLVPLSWDHHTGLSVAKRILEQLEARTAPDRLRAYVLHHWNTHLHAHFSKEEQFLAPRVAGNPSAAAMNQRLFAEHACLTNLVETLPGADGSELQEHLGKFANLLKAHIRWEESAYFPMVESLLPRDELERLGDLLHREHHHANPGEALP